MYRHSGADCYTGWSPSGQSQFLLEAQEVDLSNPPLCERARADLGSGLISGRTLIRKFDTASVLRLFYADNPPPCERRRLRVGAADRWRGVPMRELASTHQNNDNQYHPDGIVGSCSACQRHAHHHRQPRQQIVCRPPASAGSKMPSPLPVRPARSLTFRPSHSVCCDVSADRMGLGRSRCSAADSRPYLSMWSGGGRRRLALVNGRSLSFTHHDNSLLRIVYYDN